MKYYILIAIIIYILSCTSQDSKPRIVSSPLYGTWKLLTGTLIEKGDTITTNYTLGKSFIKIINQDHFAFFLHDLTKGKDSTTALYSSGSGSYTLNQDLYTEHLQYCNDRDWEGHDFTFKIRFIGDTLIQQGIEKIDSLGIERLNIERYVKM